MIRRLLCRVFGHRPGYPAISQYHYRLDFHCRRCHELLYAAEMS